MFSYRCVALAAAQPLLFETVMVESEEVAMYLLAGAP